MMPLFAAAGDGAAQVHARIEWAGLPHGVAALVALGVAAAIVAGTIMLYRRERAASAAGVRWVCCGLRLLCLAVLGAILLRPSVARDLERVLPSRLVLLVDRSASMSVRDPELPADAAAAWARALGLASPAQARRLTRHELVRGLLTQRGAEALAAATRRHQVELVTFAAEAGAVASFPRGQAAAPLDVPSWQPTGAATDLAGALEAALQQGYGPLAGVVVLTDGRDTAGGDAQAAARRAAEAGVPLHFLGVGSPLAARNVRVVELASADHALAGLPLSMQAFVQSEGYSGQEAELVLSAAGAESGRTEEVLRRAVVLAPDGRRLSVDLTHVPPLIGPVRYEARVGALGGESRTEDNAASRRVLVSEDRLRVLLVAGGPSREYRFLKGLVERAPAFELTVRLYGAAPPADGGLPTGRDALSELDAVILCDPAPTDLDAAWLEALADVVDEQAVGLVFIAGGAYTPEAVLDDALARLHDLLPVVADAARTRALVGGAGYFDRERAVSLAPEGRGHPITDPGGGADPVGYWSRMPPVYWALPALRAKRGATPLLLAEDPAFGEGTVLAATQSYGLGRVFYCGSPETWRWRRRGIEVYERFWLRALRYCTAGRVPGRRGVQMAVGRSSYTLGEAVPVEVSIADERLRPRAGGVVEVVVEHEGRPLGDLELRSVPGAAGRFGGVFLPESPGSYDLVLALPEIGRLMESFEVRPPDVEFRDLRMAPRVMGELAGSAGGRYLGPEEFAALLEAMPDRTRTVTEPGPLRPLWDTPCLLALLGLALVAEWVMRKRMGLV